jgi:hypothetical protein
VRKLLLDCQLEAALDGNVSASFLRKDRTGRQRVPFYRAPNGRCLYDPDEVMELILATRFGGKPSAPRARQAYAGRALAPETAAARVSPRSGDKPKPTD